MIAVGDIVRVGDSPERWVVRSVYRDGSALGDLVYLEAVDAATIHYEPVANLVPEGDVAASFEHTFER